VIGPTGVGLGPSCNEDEDDWVEAACDEDRDRVLYVADTLNNRITVISDALSRTTSAGSGTTLTAGRSLNGPPGLAVQPNGHILTVNAGDGFPLH
jgi:DNA-binding beta-propeller fold protein YncE